MTKHFKFSKRLHWATLCCFLFPFFYTGCGPSAGEKAAMEKVKQDSIATATIKTETSLPDSTSNKLVETAIPNIAQVDTLKEQESSMQLDTTASKTENESKTPSQRISNKLTFLQPLLIPKSDTYSGIATVIDSIPYIIYFAIFIAFLFLIISLIVKFIDIHARKTIALLDTFALIFFCISRPYSWDSERLWGFWVAAAFTFALTIYDFYLIKLSKNYNTKENCTA